MTEPDTESDVDTSRATVQTYIPQYQKELWEADAEEMNMSLSEFTRCMVQSGRRDFDLVDAEDDGTDGEAPAGEVSEEAFRQRIRTMLSEVDCLSFEEMHLLVSGDIERSLDAALMSLQAEDEIVHGRNGYELAEVDDV